MKKILLMAAVAMGLMASCNCNSACGVEGSKSDSLSMVFGRMYGFGVKGELAHDTAFQKGEFIAGMKAVLAMDESKDDYIAGMQMGMQVKNIMAQAMERDGVEMDSKIWLKEFKKAFMSDTMIDPAIFQARVMELMAAVKKEAKEKDPRAVANKMNEKKFIADSLENNPEIKKSEGGVYYKVVKEGEGENFKVSDRIMVKYTGRHLNGEVFDSSKDDAVPFSPRGVIPGMGEMLQKMKPGAVYVLYIPADLAYGTDGSGATIQPNEMLIFDVETVGLDAK